MRVDKVNPTKGIGYIKFNTDTEVDLIAESLERLIHKQEKIMERTDDIAEVKKLERFKQSKNAIVEIPKQNRMRLQGIKQIVKDKAEDLNMQNIAAGASDRVIDVEDTQEFKNMNRVMMNAEEGSGLGEGTEVTHRNVHVLVNALNEHIWQMEQDGLYKKTRRNENKYNELVQLLENAQQQKAKFERTRPKPRGFGRLRK